MPRTVWRVGAGILLAGSLACSGGGGQGEAGADEDRIRAFVGATVWDGTGSSPLQDAVLVVQGGTVRALGSAGDVTVPRGAEVVDLSDRWITPGLVNAHGHVGATWTGESGAPKREALEEELRLYARYGVTLVNSLGGEDEVALRLRDEEDVAPGRARILVAGAVVTGDTPEEALAVVEANVAMGVDAIKVRVDDNLGTTAKMAPEVYGAVIEAAHARGLPMVVHVFYLDDTVDLLERGADMIVHSVRDRSVDERFLAWMKTRGICYVPTLTREVSTFVYGERPAFFDDPFFQRHADPAVVETVLDPERQTSMRESRAAALYRQALDTAMVNLTIARDAGVTIAMGTDSGPFARFQGYFEHLEMEMMQDAGLTPEEILVAATRDAAACIGRDDLGTLEVGRRADFVVFGASPLEDVRNSRSLESVWIGGERIPDR